MPVPTQTAGIMFPIELTSGSHTLITGVDLIKSSIITIIQWPLGTRPFNGDFGSRINEALEDQNDEVLTTLVRKFIIDSISRWEQRIELTSLEVYKPTPEKLTVEAVYKIKDLDIQDTLYYSFYIN